MDICTLCPQMSSVTVRGTQSPTQDWGEGHGRMPERVGSEEWPVGWNGSWIIRDLLCILRIYLSVVSEEHLWYRKISVKSQGSVNGVSCSQMLIWDVVLGTLRLWGKKWWPALLENMWCELFHWQFSLICVSLSKDLFIYFFDIFT